MKFNTLCITIGLIVGIIVSVLVVRSMNKDGKVKTQYDERQQAVRGKAYKYGFFGVIISNVIMMVVSTCVDVSIFGLSLFFLPIFAGIVTQVSYSIFNDGYIGLNTNMKKYIIIMIIVSLINAFYAVMTLVSGEMIVDGVLSDTFINALCALLFIIIAGELIVKKCIDGRSE